MILRLAQRLAAAAIAAFTFALPASATSYSVDFSGLWWNESENGWGINFTQQADVVFATMFVYGQDQSPRWYVASGMTPTFAGGTTFQGDLFRTTGPYFGTTWSGTAQSTKVGTMTATFTGPSTATLTYSVDGVNVSKAIVRQRFRDNNLTGNFFGGITANTSACGDPVNNVGMLVLGRFVVSQGNNALGISINWVTSQGITSVCSLTGTLSQDGKFAASSGTLSCVYQGLSGGNTGTYSLSAIDVSNNAFSANFNGKDQFCTYTGRIGGVRDVQ